MQENLRHISMRNWYNNLTLLYTLRSSGARGLDVSLFYRHIAPLERKINLLPHWAHGSGKMPDLRVSVYRLRHTEYAYYFVATRIKIRVFAD